MTTHKNKTVIRPIRASSWDTTDFIREDKWNVPKVFAKFVCLNNYNHTAQGDKPSLTVVCPFCGGMMEMDNQEDFDEQ